MPTWSAGCDLGFKSDHSALVIVGHHGERYDVAEVLELKPERGKPLVPSMVVSTFADALGRYGIRQVAGDNHYSESARELFAARNIVLVDAPNGNEGKISSYLALKALLGEGRLRIPQPALRRALKGIQRRAQPGGTLEIRQPGKRGAGHSDAVSALVLAVWATQRGEGGLGEMFVESDGRDLAEFGSPDHETRLGWGRGY
jgi:hypothetical protein